MPENIQGNSPEARTETGELKSQTPPPTTPTTTPTPEPKTEAPAPEGKSLLNEEEPAQAAPETYADFKVPEGYTLDKATLEAASPIFKELNLSQDQAQKLVDFYSKTQQASAEKPYQDYIATRKGWADQVKAEFGNQLPEIKATIGRALSTLPAETSKAFREAMDLTGAGDNPAFVKVFADLAKRATEGRPVTPGGVAPVTEPGKTARPTQAAALFPKLPSSTPQ